MIRRRLVALAAILAVAFGALWPLVSAAKPGPAIPSFICTQADGAPHAPVPGGDAVDDFHCPLCIASADFVPPSLVAAAVAPLHLECAAIAAPRDAARHFYTPRPPPSRAPPALS